MILQWLSPNGRRPRPEANRNRRSPACSPTPLLGTGGPRRKRPRHPHCRQTPLTAEHRNGCTVAPEVAVVSLLRQPPAVLLRVQQAERQRLSLLRALQRLGLHPPTWQTPTAASPRCRRHSAPPPCRPIPTPPARGRATRLPHPTPSWAILATEAVSRPREAPKKQRNAKAVPVAHDEATAP